MGYVSVPGGSVRVCVGYVNVPGGSVRVCSMRYLSMPGRSVSVLCGMCEYERSVRGDVR